MPKSMEEIVSLCKRRGFVFQSSEIYGGINGFWDYGPLGVELKRNIRDAWWDDMIAHHNELDCSDETPAPFQMVGVETSIVMHPKVWKVSGHHDLFADMMTDCRETKERYRLDHLIGRWVTGQRKIKIDKNAADENATDENVPKAAAPEPEKLFVTTTGDEQQLEQRALKYFGLRKKHAEQLQWDGETEPMTTAVGNDFTEVLAPSATEKATLTEPREFNLMFETYTGAIKDDSSKAFLRPETAQGMFVNFKNVCDSSRVKLPFGIAQIGKSFRNEITPRNFTFRSREFEQMEMEFFCQPEDSQKWYKYWRDRRYQWYIALGISTENLILRDHEEAELAHYSVGTADLEYAFPFLDAGEYGELEGVAHRGNFDLRSHMEGKLTEDENGCLVVEQDENGQPKYRGSGKDLTYYDDAAFLKDKETLGVKSFKQYTENRKEEADPGAPYRYIPHVIEPAAGADRATLAFICEAYTIDEAPDDKGEMQSRTLMRFHPRIAPIKAAVFPLLKKEGMPEIATKVYGALRKTGIAVQYDQQGAIGRRYRRQDEIGTPFCITIDGETATDNCVTVRDRDTLEQKRVPIKEIVTYIRDRITV